jgi:hypothetical protein
MNKSWTSYSFLIINIFVVSSSICQVKSTAEEIKKVVDMNTYEGLLPGQIAPDAVSLDIDNFGDLINGACIIRKGNLQAMVGVDGKIIIPFGKYSFPHGFSNEQKYHRLLIAVKDLVTNLEGFINTEGKVVIPLIYKSVEPYDMYGIANVRNVKSQDLYINTNGDIIQSSGFSPLDPALVRQNINLSTTHDRIIFRKSKIIKTKTTIGGTPPYVGFMTNKGKVVISNEYPEGGIFTEGLAPVQHIDEFQVAKWGFIDKTGKLVIRYTYQIQPGNFHNGLALVQPVKRTEFSFAYINKEGVVKLILGAGTESFNYSPVKFHENSLDSQMDKQIGAFAGKYSFWYNDKGSYLLDTSGTFFPLKDLVKDEKLRNSQAGINISRLRNDGIIFQDLSQTEYYNNNVGFMDFEGNLRFPPAFNWVIPDSYSEYAYATIIHKDSDAGITGVINKQGIFVIVMQKKSTF